MSQRPPRDPQGRHVRVYCTLLDCPAWRVLGWSSRALFFDMRSSVNGSNNGNLNATLASLKHRGWTSPTTLANALFELQALGFIAKTRGGGVEHGSKVCSLYRFTDLDMFEFQKLGLAHQKATHDYLRFTTVAEAEQALHDAAAKRRENAKVITARREKARSRKKPTIQKLERTDTGTGVLKAFDDTENGAEPRATLHKLEQREGAANRPTTQAAQGNEPSSSEEHLPARSATESGHLYMLPSLAGEATATTTGKKRMHETGAGR